MRQFVLQPWTTVRGSSGSISSVLQDEPGWLDLSGWGDAAFWVDVSCVTPPTSGGPVTLTLESSPTRDENSFKTVAPPTVLSVNASPLSAPSPTLVKTVRTPTTGVLSRWTRWRLSANGSVGPQNWDATFRIRGVVGRSSYFVPTQLQNCSLWLRGDLGITLNGGNVSGWADQSGNNNNAAQANSANQPPYVATAMNGQPALKGDGANYWMKTSSFSLGAQATLIAVVQCLEAPGTQWYRRILEHNYAATYYLGTDSTGNQYKLIVDDSTAPFGTANGGTLVVGPPNVIVTGTYLAPTGTIYINGAAAAHDSTSFTTPTPTSFPMYVMAQLGGAANFWHGYLAEVIVYNRALSASELSLVHRYLGARYGVVVP